jgi:hypothetical protein
MKKRQLASWHKMIVEDFLRCSEAWIACTGPGRIVHLLAKVCTRTTMDNIVLEAIATHDL